ncbi:MAG TPA: hypothetical protein DCQ92_01160 [Verrucomicrobia subdivision 3 bacterium]|nr:hypothetical protein [Limisphaerales bacterium]
MPAQNGFHPRKNAGTPRSVDFRPFQLPQSISILPISVQITENKDGQILRHESTETMWTTSQ